MTNQEPILLREDRPDGRTTLVLNRPAQFNSLSNAMLETLLAELQSIAADKTVKYEIVMKVMGALQSANVQRVGLSVQTTP